MTNETNIRQFPGTDIPEQTLFVKRPPIVFCLHEKITLDEHSRTVRCIACEQVFDPFNFLRNEVSRLQGAWDSYRQVQDKLREQLDRVDTLKKEEARLKGRIKTARAKAEPVIDVRNRSL